MAIITQKSDNLLYALKYSASPDGPLYGWKILQVNDNGILISPVFNTVWPNDGYLVAPDFPHDHKPGDSIRGTTGIHAVGSDNLSELRNYIGQQSVLTLLQFAGKVYVGKSDEERTTILAEKAKPVGAISYSRPDCYLISQKYNIPCITFDLVFQGPQFSNQETDLGNDFVMVETIAEIEYTPEAKKLFAIMPELYWPNANEMFQIFLSQSASDIKIYQKEHKGQEHVGTLLLDDVGNISQIYYDKKDPELFQAIGKSILYHARNTNFADLYALRGDGSFYALNKNATGIGLPLLVLFGESSLFFLNPDLSLALEVVLYDGTFDSYREYQKPSSSSAEAIRNFMLNRNIMPNFLNIREVVEEFTFLNSQKVTISTIDGLYSDEIESTLWPSMEDLHKKPPVDVKVEYDEYLKETYGILIPLKEVRFYDVPNELIFDPRNFIDILEEALRKYEEGSFNEYDVEEIIMKMGDIINEDYHMSQESDTMWTRYTASALGLEEFIEKIRAALGSRVERFLDVIRESVGR